MASKKTPVKTTSKKIKKSVKKPVKSVKKVQVVSQSVKSKTKQPKATLTTTSKNVDTSTLVNKWIGSDFNNALDNIGLEPLHTVRDTSIEEHKMFEADNIQREEIKLPFWVRILWWFVKK